MTNTGNYTYFFIIISIFMLNACLTLHYVRSKWNARISGLKYLILLVETIYDLLNFNQFFSLRILI